MSSKLTAILLIALFILGTVAIYEGRVAMEALSLIGTLRQQNLALNQEISQLHSSISAYTETIASLQALIRELNETLANYEAQVGLLNLEISRLQRNLTSLQEARAKLLVELEKVSAEKEALRSKLERVTVEKNELQSKLNLLEAEYRAILEERNKLQSRTADLLKLVDEVFYYRAFRVYNYKDGSTWLLYYRIPAEDYFLHRLNVECHQPITSESELAPEMLANASSAYDDPVIREVAKDLIEISRGDQELLVNLALQLVHQLYYNETVHLKYPVETLVESSGDCDNLSVLLASILRAAGVRVALILGTAKDMGHAMVGVALDAEPDDLMRYGRYRAWYVPHEGRKFYLAETTWPPIGSPNYVDPASRDALFINGALVGDNPWGDDFKILRIIVVP